MAEANIMDELASADSHNGAGTIAWLLKSGSLRASGGPALLLNDGSHLTHADLQSLVVQAEADLRGLGIGRQTRVMTALPDSPLTACVLLALTRSAICAPVNPDLRRAEVETLIPELGAEVLVAHGACADEARRAATAHGLPILEVAWEGTKSLRWSGAALASAPAEDRPASADDTSLILLTSGSSARPKRVPLTHRHLTLSASRMAQSLALTASDVCLNMMPMFHVGAVVDLLLAPLSVGGSLTRPETMSVPAFFEALDKLKPTWFQGVPTLLHELAVHALRRGGAHQRSTLRLVRSVSSPLPPEWINEIEAALGAPVIEIYGMTETAGVITSNPLPPELRKVGSVGRPTASMEVIVRDASGAQAAMNARGEIMVRGSGVMTGYEKLDSQDRGLTDDGWLKTGDEGYFDAEGFLFITGRINDQINRGGEKVSPREIDEVLVSHPGVQDAAAFAVPHPHLGQDVAAAIVAKPGATLTAEELTTHVSSQLAYFKVPKAFYLVPELPRGPGGKLRRRLLPELVRDLQPMAHAEADAAEAPQTDMEKRVAAWWESELKVSGIGRNGDFFELGGDSLTAAAFTVGIEKLLGVQVRPAALFDHPTVSSFARYLEQAMASQSDGAAANATKPEPAMNPDLFRRLLAAMSVWPGVRRDESSLLVGLRTEGKGTPIFWCGQGRPEYDSIVEHLPPEHPIYGTRSLYLFEGKKRQDEEALARIFANEVEQLRAGREVILGGFCAGGRIAFDAACHLRSRGVPVKMVFMHETWSTQSIDVPVALGFTVDSTFSPYREFARPEVLMNKRFTAGWSLSMFRTAHNGIYAAEPLSKEVQKLRSLWTDPSKFQRPAPMEEVPGIAYRAKLECGLHTPIMLAGWPGFARVKVTNLSKQTWLPAARSGLHLGQRWLDAEGKVVGDPGPSAPLSKVVPPGKSFTFTLKIPASTTIGMHTLEIDMVDEGICWFSEKQSKQPSQPLRLQLKITSLFRQRTTLAPNP